MEGEGFGEENEGEDNTDRLAESGDSHGKEGSELSDQAQDNLNIYRSQPGLMKEMDDDLNPEVASQREDEGIAVGVFGIVWAVVDGGGDVCEDGHQEK